MVPRRRVWCTTGDQTWIHDQFRKKTVTRRFHKKTGWGSACESAGASWAGVGALWGACPGIGGPGHSLRGGGHAEDSLAGSWTCRRRAFPIACTNARCDSTRRAATYHCFAVASLHKQIPQRQTNTSQRKKLGVFLCTKYYTWKLITSE